MIIDTNVLTDVTHTDSYVIGKSAKSTQLLKKGERVMLFSGLRTAIDYISSNLHDDAPYGEGSSKDIGGRNGFHFFPSFSHTVEVFTKRPGEVVKYDPTELQPTEFMEVGTDLEYDVTGDYIDMGRHLEGIPESFGSMHNGSARARRVRIVVGLANSSSMRDKEINHRSERIIRLVDALENAHVRTEVLVVDTNECSHTEIVVKRFDESLVIEDIAVATHSEFFRRLLFRASEWSETWRMGYGTSTLLKENMSILRSQLNDEITIYVDSNMYERSIDTHFDRLEALLVEELSQPIPELSLVTVTDNGVTTARLDG